MIDTKDRKRLHAYSGGFLGEGRLKRILDLAGWDISLGVPGSEDWVGIWGRSPTAWRGEAVAGWAEAQVLTVEDAFLRSVHPNRVKASAPIGLCLDKTGVHFDATAPSDLEKLLATHPLDDTALLNRARAATWRATSVICVTPVSMPQRHSVFFRNVSATRSMACASSRA